MIKEFFNAENKLEFLLNNKNAVLLLLFLCFPFGLFLFFKSPLFTKKNKLIVAGVIIGIVLLSLVVPRTRIDHYSDSYSDSRSHSKSEDRYDEIENLKAGYAMGYKYDSNSARDLDAKNQQILQTDDKVFETVVNKMMRMKKDEITQLATKNKGKLKTFFRGFEKGFRDGLRFKRYNNEF